LWDVLLPIASYVLVAIAAASWALEAPFANMTGALAVVLLLVTALRNSWMVARHRSRQVKVSPTG
jgi:hypothetical protein